MRTFAGLAQQITRAARDDFTTLANEDLEQLLEIEQARLTVVERDHVEIEAVLPLRVAEQVGEHDIRVLVAAQLDHHAHAGLVRLVAQLSAPLALTFFDQVSNLLEQSALVPLIWASG